MSIEIAIAHQAPILEVATTQLAVSIPDKSTIEVESAPITGIVQFIAVKGDKGVDGITPDFGDAGTIADMLAALSGQITSSQLHSELLNSVNKIDVGPSSLEAQTALLAYADTQINAAIAEAADKISLNELAITTAQSAITTLGSDLASLDGEVTGQASAIDSLSTRVTVAEHDIVTQAQSVSGLSTRIDNVESAQTAQAAIVNQNTVAITEIDGDITSTAETLSTITAGVGGMAAAIQLKNEVIAGITKPLYAQNTVKLDVNGKVSGYGLASTETSSVFEILADRFAVTNGLNNGIIPFIVDGANVYIQNGFIQNAAIDEAKIANAAITAAKIKDAEITNAKIANGTIENAKIKDATIEGAKIKDATIESAKIADLAVDTLKIADEAVTLPLAFYGGNGVTTGSVTSNTFKKVVISLSGYTYCNSYNGVYQLTITRNGTTIFSTSIQGFGQIPLYTGCSLIDYVEGLPYVVYVVSLSNGSVSGNFTFTIIGVKK